MSLAILFHFLCAQHVSDINISIIRSLRLCCWITTSVVLFSVRCVLELWCGWFWVVFVLQAEACNTDTTQHQPHQISNTQRTENKMTDVVIQQHSSVLLKMDIFMSETCWAHKQWNKITSDIKLVFHSSNHTSKFTRLRQAKSSKCTEDTNISPCYHCIGRSVGSVTDWNSAAKIRILMAQRGLEIQFKYFTQIEITDECLRKAQYHHHHHEQQQEQQQQEYQQQWLIFLLRRLSLKPSPAPLTTTTTTTNNNIATAATPATTDSKDPSKINRKSLTGENFQMSRACTFWVHLNIKV